MGSLLEMLMIEDMVHAEAVVSGAAGAVAELQAGVVLVGDAAHRALVQVAPGLPGLFLRLLYILYGVFWPFSGFLFCENDV